MGMAEKALDLFCCQGGATRGLQLAGYHVTGVDIEPQPRYVGDRFVRDDAMAWLRGEREPLDSFSLIWASPPCQAYSRASQGMRNGGKEYPNLLPDVRAALVRTDVPWIIENVPGAPMRADYRLCGCQFGLELRRERWFETSWNGFDLRPSCYHPYPVVSVVGHGTPTWVRQKLGFNPTIHDYRAAMDIDWMSRDGLSQAIPPAYAKFLAEQMQGVLA